MNPENEASIHKSSKSYPHLVENRQLAGVSKMSDGDKDSNDIDAWYKEYKNKYFPMVYRRCLGILRNHEDAEDIAQDVFEKLQRQKTEGRLNIQSSGGPGGLLSQMAKNLSINQTWKTRREILTIYSIATNASINRIREKNKGVAEIWNTMNSRAALESNSSGDKFFFDEGFSQVEAKIFVEEVLNEEDEITRDIYFMRYHDEMTLVQIGEAVGLSKSAVEKRIRKIKKRVLLKWGKDKK